MPLSSTMIAQAAQEPAGSATQNNASQALPHDEAATCNSPNSDLTEDTDEATIAVPTRIMCSGANKDFNLALRALCVSPARGAGRCKLWVKQPWPEHQAVFFFDNALLLLLMHSEYEPFTGW